MSKIKTVLVREYLVQIRRAGFWIGTLGLPLFLVLTFLLALWIGWAFAPSKPSKSSQQPVIALVDAAEVLDVAVLNRSSEEGTETTPAELSQIWEQIELSASTKQALQGLFAKTVSTLNGPGYRYEAYANRQAAYDAVKQKQVKAAFVVDADWQRNLNCELILYDEKEESRVGLSAIRTQLQTALLSLGFPPERHADVLQPTRNMVRSFTFSKPKKELGELIAKIRAMVLPLLFMMLMLLAIMTSTDRLLRGLMEEKQNRVIELLLSSVTANQLMAGKVLGLGLIGLTQLAIWLLAMVVPLTLVVTFLQVSWLSLLTLVAFFVAGYLLLATFMLAFGSLGRDYQEASQWSLLWILLTLAPTFFLGILIEAPESGLSRLLTFIPFSSPMTVAIRMGMDKIGPWETTAAWLFLLLNVVLGLRLGARLFRLGILMTGKAPNPIELFRLFRHAA
jgi:ABC-2 type transport system permease protein